VALAKPIIGRKLYISALFFALIGLIVIDYQLKFTGGNAIASIRLSVCVFLLYLSNRLTFYLDLLHVYGSTYPNPNSNHNRTQFSNLQPQTLTSTPKS